MNRIATVFVIMAALGAFVYAQTGGSQPTAQETHSTLIVEKIYKVDLLNQILPLLMTKEQLKALLPSIEDARQNVATVKKKEYEELRRLEGMLDRVISEGIEKGEVPKSEDRALAMKTIGSLSMGRQFVAASNSQKVADKLKEVLNKGQLKAAANSLDSRFLEGKKVEEVSEDERINIFVREVLLHPQAYEVMRKMSL
jgi:hypothetical protein